MSIKVSVILPVYNVEKFIGRCIESLKVQTLNDLEFIFVDDCGKDSSMKHVEEFAASDSRVRIIRNDKNMGAGASRNAGIEAAQGRYLSFIDPDDYISSDFFVRLYSKAIITDSEVAKCYCTIDAKGTSARPLSDPLPKKALKHGRPIYYQFINRHFSAIYKRTLFEDPRVRFGTTAYGEDTTFLLRVLYGVKSFVYEDHARYYYCLHSENVTGTFSYRRSMEELAALKDKVDFLLEKPMDKFASFYIRRKLLYCLNNFCLFMRDNTSLRQDEEAYAKMVDSYSTTMKKLTDRLPQNVLSQGGLEELLIFFRYKVLIPTDRNDSNGNLEWRVTAWTDFIVKHPDAENDLLRGYAYTMLACSLPLIIPFRKTFIFSNPKRKSFLQEQYNRLNANQKRKVLLYLPTCMVSYIRRSFRHTVLGL